MVTGTIDYVISEQISAPPKSKIAIKVPSEFVINEVYLEQRYFWGEEWQSGEHEADDDIKNGRVNNFKNAKDTIKYLRSKRK